jgi:short-subunit dehydrogenase
MNGHVLVLGAGSDIGRALAREYARQGWGLFLAGREPDALERDAADLETRFGVEARALAFDALDFGGHKEFYSTLEPSPDVVVCVVGLMGEQERAEHDIEEARRVMETNYIGCVSLLNVVANEMEQMGAGTIIGVSSVAGDRGRASNYIYGSAKAGFSAYLSGLRNRLSGKGVHVMTVKPGFVNTRMTRGMDLPKRLMAEPEEVARDIVRAQKRGRDVLYTKWFWRFIMLIITHIPERVFKRMSL